MDALAVSAIIVAITGMVVSTLSVIKHSECLGNCCKIDTRTPTTPSPPANPPLLNQEPSSQSPREVVV
jgi:hypothetical protein